MDFEIKMNPVEALDARPRSAPMHPDCQLNVEPFFQCCCTCVYRLPVHHHCCTSPKPDPKTHEGRCVCGVQKGWACVAPEFGRVYDNWPEHSCGCEMHTTRESLQPNT